MGFQDFVNPLAKDTSSPLAKEAIVLGDNASKFSTLENGRLHWDGLMVVASRWLGTGRFFPSGARVYHALDLQLDRRWSGHH